MTISPAQFVTNFPAFQNPTAYPIAQIQFWLTQAYSQLNAFSLGEQLDYAAQLFTAHKLVLAFNASQVTAGGGGGGQSAGMVASKSVGGASISYDTGSTAIPGAGEYNATTWGQMLWPILRGALAGPIYVPASFDATAQRGFGAFPFRRRGFLGF
jgi:hypothetical protein